MINNDKDNSLPKHNSDEWSIDKIKPLGRGSFSDVYKARKLNRNPLSTGKVVPKKGCVVKIIGQDHTTKIGLKEIDIIDRLLNLESCGENCDHIIQFYGYGFKDGALYIYMEYLDGFKSLKEIIEGRVGKRLDENEILDIYEVLLKALQFIHRFNIIHRDIKCDNILYNEQTKQVKLIDFGISKYTQTKASTYCGTPTHMAPEAKLGNTTSKSDMWSLGCTLIEMAGGDLSNTNQDGITPIIPNHLSNESIKLIQLFLTKDTFFRPNASLNHLEDYGSYSRHIDPVLLDLNKTPIDKYLRTPLSKMVNIELRLLNFNYQIHPLSFIQPTIAILSIENAIPASLIPSSVKHLILRTFNESITPDLVPSTVSILKLSLFNQPIQPNSIPSSIVALTIPSFNHNLDEDSLPETLKLLDLGRSFNFDEYSDNLPSSLKIFRCEYNFKSPLKKNNNIPRGVCSLVLPNYNQPIVKSSISENTSTLILGSRYTHYESLANIPSSVIGLKFDVENLDNETQNTIQKFTPTSVRELVVNNIRLR